MTVPSRVMVSAFEAERMRNVWSLRVGLPDLIMDGFLFGLCKCSIMSLVNVASNSKRVKRCFLCLFYVAAYARWGLFISNIRVLSH